MNWGSVQCWDSAFMSHNKVLKSCVVLVSTQVSLSFSVIRLMQIKLI